MLYYSTHKSIKKQDIIIFYSLNKPNGVDMQVLLYKIHRIVGAAYGGARSISRCLW